MNYNDGYVASVLLDLKPDAEALYREGGQDDVILFEDYVLTCRAVAHSVALLASYRRQQDQLVIIKK